MATECFHGIYNQQEDRETFEALWHKSVFQPACKPWGDEHGHFISTKSRQRYTKEVYITSKHSKVLLCIPAHETLEMYSSEPGDIRRGLFIPSQGLLHKIP